MMPFGDSPRNHRPIPSPLRPSKEVSYNRRMTICIGALAAGGKSIVCVADKGLSYGPGIQWDSDSTKIVPVGSSGVQALISGGELMISRVLRGLAAIQGLGQSVPNTITECER